MDDGRLLERCADDFRSLAQALGRFLGSYFKLYRDSGNDPQTAVDALMIMLGGIGRQPEPEPQDDAPPAKRRRGRPSKQQAQEPPDVPPPDGAIREPEQLAEQLMQEPEPEAEPKPEPESPPEPPLEPPPEQEPTPPPLTKEQVRAVLAEKARAGHSETVRALLVKHGAPALSEIDPINYPALLTDAEVIGMPEGSF